MIWLFENLFCLRRERTGVFARSQLLLADYGLSASGT
jgi:hypothetical protein